MLSSTLMITCLIVGLMRKILLYKMSYYSEPDSHIRNKIKVELNLRQKEIEKKRDSYISSHTDLSKTFHKYQQKDTVFCQEDFI